MLLPKRVKYRRVHRGRMKGKAMRGNTIAYGEFGLQAIELSLIHIWVIRPFLSASSPSPSWATRRRPAWRS